MSRFPGKVNLVNLIKKKNRNLLVFKRVQVTSTNGEDNLTTNTSTSNGSGDFSHVKSESDLDFNNSPSPLVPSSRQDTSSLSSTSSSPDNGHEAVSTSDRTSSSIHHQAAQSIADVVNINNNTNGSKNDNNCVNSSSSSDNVKYDPLTRQDIRENILNSKEIKASTGLSFFQSLVNPTSASPDKSLDEDEDNEDEEKFTFEGFSQDEVDENRRRILQEYELLSTDSRSSSDSADSDYVNCKSNIEDSTSDDSDTPQSNDEEQQPPVTMSSASSSTTTATTTTTTITTTTSSSSKCLQQSTTDSSCTMSTASANCASNLISVSAELKGKLSSSQVTLRSTGNASPTVSSSPGVKITSKNRRSSASKVNPAKDNNRHELTCKETQQQPKTSRLVKSRPNYESNGVEDEISNGKRKSVVRKKKSQHLTDSITDSPVNSSDDVLSSFGSKISTENPRKKRKISTGKEASGNATACDDSSLIISTGTTSTTTTTTSSSAASTSTASTTSTQQPLSSLNSTLNKCTSPVLSSSTNNNSNNNNVKVTERGESRPLTINSNYETISSSKRRKEEIISRALVALQSQWRERFIQSQQSQQSSNGTHFKSTNGHMNLKCNEFDSKGEKTLDSSTLSINGSFKCSTGNLDSTNYISSTSGSFSTGSKFNCSLTSNDSPAFSSSSTGPSNSILRQPRLQVNQSTLNYIRSTHRNSLESSSRGSRSSVSSESSISPSNSDSESSYESSSSEEEQEDSLSTDDDDDGEEEEVKDESSSNDESSDSNDPFDSPMERKKQAKSFTNNFTSPPSKVKKTKDNCIKVTGKKCSNGTNGSVNRTSGNSKTNDNTTSVNSNPVKSKKSPVKSTEKKGEKKITKGRSENVCKSKKKNPGTITCAICFTVKYYSHKQRRFGQFSCEPCSKFFASFLRSPRAYFCEHTGDCAIDTTSGNGRCRACWLKLCLQKFNFPDKVRGELTENNFLPKLKSEPHVSLIAVDTGSNKELSVVTTSNSIGRNILDISYQCTNTSPSKGKSNGINGHPKLKKNNSSNGNVKHKLKLPNKLKGQNNNNNVKSNTGLLMLAPQQSTNINSSSLPGQNDQNSSSIGGRGPRVKRVCRTIATGLPRATFSSRETDEFVDEDIEDDEDEIEQTSDQSSDDVTSSSDDSSTLDEEDEEEDGDDDDDDDDEESDADDSASVDSDSLPVTEYIIRAFKRETGQNTGQDAGPEGKKKVKKIKNKKVAKDQMKNGKKSSSSSPSKSSSPVHRSSAGKKVTVKKNKKQGQQQSKVNSNNCQQSKRSKNSNNIKSATANKKAANSSSDSSSCLKLFTSNSNTPTTSSSPVKKVIKKRCGTCSGCTALDCGECTFCKDKKKFGGPNIIKQACKLRKCIQMTSPQQ